MLNVDDLLADLEVSLPLSHLTRVSDHASVMRSPGDGQSRGSGQLIATAKKVSCLVESF